MNLSDFAIEYHCLTEERRKRGLQALFDEILRDIDRYDGFIDSILEEAADAENDDYFGTEGLDV